MPDGWMGKLKRWGAGTSIEEKMPWHTPPATTPPQAPSAPPSGIGEWNFELYYKLLQDMFDREERAEFDEVKQADLKEKNDYALAEALMFSEQGLWGTAEQHRFPQHQAIFKSYQGWAETQMPEAPEAIVADTEPFSKGGYDFYRQLDAQGNVIGTKFIGETSTEGMTEYQRATLEQDRLEFEQTAAYQQSQMRQAEMQAAIQLGAMGEEGWIQSYLSGYARQMMAMEKEKVTARGMKWRAQEKLTAAGGPLGQIRRPMGLTVGAQKAQVKITKAGEKIKGVAARQRALPATPPTPEWLPQFAPWLSAGQPITKGQMATPSGQQWQTITPSVMGGLKGFAKWGGAGRSLEDIYAEMVRMQPQEPFGGRGRWRTARQ